eukprot:2626954-Lingulodinium_polyedra.AAC.1
MASPTKAASGCAVGSPRKCTTPKATGSGSTTSATVGDAGGRLGERVCRWVEERGGARVPAVPQ